MKSYIKLVLFLSTLLSIGKANGQSLVYSPTITFNTSSNTSGIVTLTANLTTFAIPNGTSVGQTFAMNFCQDSLGNRVIKSGPANYIGTVSIDANPLACTELPVYWNGSYWVVKTPIVTYNGSGPTSAYATLAQLAAVTTIANQASTAAASAAGVASTASAAATAASNAQTLATTANTTANTAQTTANTAASNAAAAQTAASSAQSTAVSASNTATTAQSVANAAQTAANNAATLAGTANTNATAAQTAASNAQSTANTASTNATAAQNTANTASTTATNAATTAGNAQTTANTANTNATAAQTTANAAIPSTQKGAASGVAPLDSTSKVPIVNIPTIPVSQVSVNTANNGYFSIFQATGGSDVYPTFSSSVLPVISSANHVPVYFDVNSTQHIITTDDETHTLSNKTIVTPLIQGDTTPGAANSGSVQILTITNNTTGPYIGLPLNDECVILNSMVSTTTEYREAKCTSTGGTVQYYRAPLYTLGSSGSWAQYMYTASNGNVSFFGTTSSQFWGYTNTCTSSASPAVCTNNAAGRVAVAPGATTLQVNTTGIDSATMLNLTFDASLSTALGITCATTPPTNSWISARTNGSNFTITTSSAPAAGTYFCYSYTNFNY